MKKIALEITFVSLLLAAYVLLIISICLKFEYGIAISLVVLFVCFLFAIIKSLIKSGSYRWYDWLEPLLAFISIIVILIVFIASFPPEIKDAVIQLSSATIGGSLTLYGVGITIRHSKMEKEREETKRARPIVFPISETTWGGISKEKRTCVLVDINEKFSELKMSEEKDKYVLSYILIANSDASLCSLFGILVNNKLIKFEYEQVLAKNSYNLININSGYGFSFVLEENIKSVSVLLTDILGNVYECISRFEVDKDRTIIITSFLETKIYESVEN